MSSQRERRKTDGCEERERERQTERQSARDAPVCAVKTLVSHVTRAF